MNKVIHKIAEVKTQDDLTLWVRFVTGETKIYDVKPLIKRHRAFEPLELDEDLFNKVYVAGGGYGLIWNEKIDLSSDELWHNGKIIEEKRLA